METLLPKDQTELASIKKTKTVQELGEIDISTIKDSILTIPEELWKTQDGSKPNKFQQLGTTKHIVFKFIHDYDDHLSGYDLPIWEEWQDRLQPILDAVAKPYGYQKGGYSRVMIDPYGSSINTHKIHIPITTNPEVEFWVGRKRYHFEEGYGYEVNNKALHGGVNHGETDRINLIIEYFEV